MGKFVYFIKPVGMAGPIKIGCSSRPSERAYMMTLFSPVKLEVALKIPWSFDLEKNIHLCFADCHSHGEWFHPIPRLLKAIDDMAMGVPTELAIDLSSKKAKSIRNKQVWPPLSRQKMSVLHKVRGACNKIGVSYFRAPSKIRHIMDISEARMLSKHEIMVIDSFRDDPVEWVKRNENS